MPNTIVFGATANGAKTPPVCSTWGISKLKTIAARFAYSNFTRYFFHEVIIANKGGGKVLKGLVIRRQAESNLFQGQA